MRRRKGFRVTPVRLQGDLEEIRYTKRDDGYHYKHETDGPSDLWLVDVDGKRGSLVLPRGNNAGWEKDGDTYWLTNRPMKKRTTKKARRRAPTARQSSTKSKRPPPAGFETWSAYMASIRPNRGGSSMAKKRRRRRSYGKRRTTHRRNSPVRAAAASRPRRRHYRRNPAFSVRGVIGHVTDAGKGAMAMIVGEGSTRYVRKNLLKMDDGKTVSTLADAGIGVAGGLAVEKFMGRQAGRDFTAGVFAYIGRAIAKQLGISAVNDVLGDALGSNVRRFVVRNGKLVPAGRLSGYVGRGDGRLSGFDGYAGRGTGRPVENIPGAGF